MKKIIKSSTGHAIIKNYSTGEVLWEGEMPSGLPEFAPASCAVDEYDALMRRLYLRLHRKLWNWIADETERTHKCVDKWDAFNHFGWRKSIDAQCWACQYIRWRRKYRPSKIDCDDLCIVDWGVSERTGKNMCCVFNAPFNLSAFELWDACLCDQDWRKAAKAARIIANLPERE